MRHSDMLPQTTRAADKPLFTLATLSTPLLPPLKPDAPHKKTLILDLDETLVHSVTKATKKAVLSLMFKVNNKPNMVHVLFRPHAEEFIVKAAELYELVIFTASQKYYADYVINKLDPSKHVSHRLYREHCVISTKKFIKDLSNIGRDLKDVIIVDNSPAAYEWNSDNAIPIETWTEREDDTQLEKLFELLKDLARVEDVRRFLVKPWEHGNHNYQKISELVKAEAKPLSIELPREEAKEEPRNSLAEEPGSCKTKGRSSAGAVEKTPRAETGARNTVGATETKPRRYFSIKQVHKPPGYSPCVKNVCHAVLRPSGRAHAVENKENVDTRNTPRVYFRPTPLQSMKNVPRSEQKTSFGYNSPKETNRMINIYYPKNTQGRYSDIRENAVPKDVETPKYGVLPNPWKQKGKPLLIKGNYPLHNLACNRRCGIYRNYGPP
eukprot:TRINITY_DN7799_c0_g1_i4.p1 TRINITY_DN7799_c0_g1~~TRINITY_DN7799_c0_g1_i4.p1  ORF type:complete len:438 (-),score=114.62 TRINITY_DN7799_c0_g1_i4:239-1552(-)